MAQLPGGRGECGVDSILVPTGNAVSTSQQKLSSLFDQTNPAKIKVKAKALEQEFKKLLEQGKDFDLHLEKKPRIKGKGSAPSNDNYQTLAAIIEENLPNAVNMALEAVENPTDSQDVNAKLQNAVVVAGATGHGRGGGRGGGRGTLKAGGKGGGNAAHAPPQPRRAAGGAQGLAFVKSHTGEMVEVTTEDVTNTPALLGSLLHCVRQEEEKKATAAESKADVAILTHKLDSAIQINRIQQLQHSLALVEKEKQAQGKHSIPSM